MMGQKPTDGQMKPIALLTSLKWLVNAVDECQQQITSLSISRRLHPRVM